MLRFIPIISIFLVLSSFGSDKSRPQVAMGNACPLHYASVTQYSFLHPEIVNSKAAYAPFLVEFGDMYNNYFKTDIQRIDNLKEWQERFCHFSPIDDIERVVYKSSPSELRGLYAAIQARERTAPEPFETNNFANQIVESRCTEVLNYLLYASGCEAFTQTTSALWQRTSRDSQAMADQIIVGLDHFRQTESNFLRMRYAYQIVRLAHYAHNYPQVIELYNYLMPNINKRRNSIIYYWALGHLAGALRATGKYAEAAYRYSVIFRNCPSKRMQAFQSFYLRNDKDWQATLKLCENDKERATLYILRSGRAKSHLLKDLEDIYRLNPDDNQLGLLLISHVQSLEKLLLQTPFGHLKSGEKYSQASRDKAGYDLVKLQEFTRKVIEEGKADNLILWECMEAYMELLAGNHKKAELSLKSLRKRLKEKDPYESHLLTQIALWEHLLSIRKINPTEKYAEDEAVRLRSFAVHQLQPNFEPYLQEYIGAAYEANSHPGKAVLAAFDTKALLYYPNLAQLDDLIQTSEKTDQGLLEKGLTTDSLATSALDQFLEIKGTYLMSIGELEAAHATFSKMSNTAKADKSLVFTPFKADIRECTNCIVQDSVLLNRWGILKKLREYEYQAKANFDKPDDAAHFYYLLGLGHYNMSYFGHSWRVMDYFRSGAAWDELAKGPVYPNAKAPFGNHENLQTDVAEYYFKEVIARTTNKELAAQAAFMAARCQQKAWFISKTCTYRPGNKYIPVLPDSHNFYYQLLGKTYKDTEFYTTIIKECKWFEKYSRRF